MSSANPLWGAPRIHGELLKLGIEVSQATVAKYSPWQNPYVEPVIVSIRRECLDHMVIFKERHLRRVLSSNVYYYQRSRTHLSLDKDCPDSRPISASQRRKNRRHPESRWLAPSLRTPRCLIRRGFLFTKP
jgi:Integrase core domain